jgi:hypothetical protein
MMAARVLAVVSAVLLVLAFALAVMLPPLTTLAEAVTVVNHGWLVALQDTIRGGLSEWAWMNLVMPVLVRPAWLLPAGLGIVVAGTALTLSRSDAPRSHRRRS